MNAWSWLKLIAAGVIAGLILAGFLKLIHWFTGNEAYILLFNVDYIPLLKHLPYETAVGLALHFVICVLSVIVLFYFLKFVQLERRIAPYLVAYTGGSAMLFFLTALTDRPPAATDFAAWFYWNTGHFFFGFAVGLFMKRWTP